MVASLIVKASMRGHWLNSLMGLSLRDKETITHATRQPDTEGNPIALVSSQHQDAGSGARGSLV